MISLDIKLVTWDFVEWNGKCKFHSSHSLTNRHRLLSFHQMFRFMRGSPLLRPSNNAFCDEDLLSHTLSDRTMLIWSCQYSVKNVSIFYKETLSRINNINKIKKIIEWKGVKTNCNQTLGVCSPPSNRSGQGIRGTNIELFCLCFYRHPSWLKLPDHHIA